MVQLAEDLGVAPEQAGHEEAEQTDRDGFEQDEGEQDQLQGTAADEAVTLTAYDTTGVASPNSSTWSFGWNATQ